jgi:hypothetical protein
VVAVTLQGADQGDTTTLQGADQGDTTTLDETLCEAGIAVEELAGREAELRPDDPPRVNLQGIEEVVTDKGYHGGAVVQRVKSYEVRSYIPEKQQKGRRNWQGKAEEQQAVYQNRRRVQGNYGKSLLRRRGELVERSFSHCWSAAYSPARTPEHPETAVDPRGCLQSEPDPAPDVGGASVLRLFLRLFRWDGHNWLGRSSISEEVANYFARSPTRRCRTSRRKSVASTTDC